MSQMVGILDNEYDVITGVSVGSINAMGFGVYDYGQGKEMVEYMTELWRGMTNDQIYRAWAEYDPIMGITSESGFYDNTPLLN